MSRRDLLSALALAVLSGISLAAAAQVVWLGTASRREFGREELIAWLAQRDLSAVPRADKLRLARQFEQDFAAGHDWQEELDEWNESQREQLAENYAELSQTWFLDKVDRYFELQEPERTEYVDSQIDDIARWPILERGKFAAGNLSWNGDLGRRLPQLQNRFTHLKPAQQQRVQQFAGAVYLRWLARGFQQLIPISPGEN